ncbi:hypothetical protein [Terriglobus sp.]|uniref:hypothetical protein n=1 Tax=Terriglobus sp. TaxID=1889013 RepID=UPI003B00BF2E
MKLAITAVVLSTALTLPLAAQTVPNSDLDAPTPPAPFGMHPGGPHGARGRGMFGPGMAAHHVETISNEPFTAQFTGMSNFTDHQSKQQQRSTTSTVYRDSQGRVREEVTLPAPPPRPPAAADSGTAPAAPPAPRGPRTMVIILDPVAHTITHLNADRQTAYVQNVPADFFTHMQQRAERRESGQSPQQRRDNATSTDLGSKLVAGLPAKGEQTTLTFPARDGGSAHTITRQNWFSPDLKLEVSSSETSDRGTRSETLTSLNKAEPNPSLFQVPTGYTTTNTPDRSFAGGHHGRGQGPGSPAGDEDVPPPPL